MAANTHSLDTGFLSSSTATINQTINSYLLHNLGYIYDLSINKDFLNKILKKHKGHGNTTNQNLIKIINFFL